MNTKDTFLNTKEKVVTILVIFLIKMLKPWEYDHQFTQFWDELKSVMDESEIIVSGKDGDKKEMA